MELRYQTLDVVRELVLDNCQSNDGKTEGLVAEFVDFKLLSLINVCVISVPNLPKLPKLKELELMKTKCLDSWTCQQKKIPNFTHLHLSGNKVRDISTFRTFEKVGTSEKPGSL